MPVGNPVNISGLNSQLGDMAVAWRDTANQAIILWSYVASLGANEAAQVAALVTIGFSAADAQTFWTLANNGFALAQLYFGQITQPAAFDYDNALAAARGAN